LAPRGLEELDGVAVGILDLHLATGGPDSISLRKRIPARFIAAMPAGRSVASSTMRFHPPGSWDCPDGIARDPDAPGPLSRRSTPPSDSAANCGRC